MSERAYYFWPGCEHLYGTALIDYSAENKIKVLKSKKEMLKALYKTSISYLDLPSMYTTSLFSKRFINLVKQKTGGHLFITHPQDADLAAWACLFTDKYLKSYIPLGWVGTSSVSAGLAILELNNNNETALSNEYLDSIKKSSLPYHKLAYDFRIPSLNLYFWNALLCVTEKCNMQKEYNYLINRNTKIKLFSFIQREYPFNEVNKQLFNELLSVNDISVNDLKIHNANKNALFIIAKKIKHILCRKKVKNYSLVLDKEISDISLLKADSYVCNRIRKDLI
jgi:hypothetical protein